MSDYREGWDRGWSAARTRIGLCVDSLRLGPRSYPSGSPEYDAGWLACCDAVKKELDRQR